MTTSIGRNPTPDPLLGSPPTTMKLAVVLATLAVAAAGKCKDNKRWLYNKKKLKGCATIKRVLKRADKRNKLDQTLWEKQCGKSSGKKQNATKYARDECCKTCTKYEDEGWESETTTTAPPTTTTTTPPPPDDPTGEFTEGTGEFTEGTGEFVFAEDDDGMVIAGEDWESGMNRPCDEYEPPCGDYRNLKSDWRLMGETLDGGEPDLKMGESVAISGNGVTMVAGGSAAGVGRAIIYEYAGCCGEMAWTKDFEVTGYTDHTGAFVAFAAGAEVGKAVAASGDGSRVAVGVPGFDGARGMVVVFEKRAGAWSQMGNALRGYLREPGDRYGDALAMTRDGAGVVASAPSESGFDIDGAYTADLGAVYLYKYEYGAWNLRGSPVHGDYVGEQFGKAVDVSDRADVIAVSAPKAPVGDDAEAGEVRVFELHRRDGWKHMGANLFLVEKDESKVQADDAEFGYALSLSGQGERIAIGAPGQRFGRGRVHTYAWTRNQAIGVGAWVKYPVEADGSPKKSALFGECGPRDEAGACAFKDRLGSKVKLSSSGENLVVSSPTAGQRIACNDTTATAAELAAHAAACDERGWFPRENMGMVKAYRWAQGRNDWVGNGAKIWGLQENAYFGESLDFTDDANIVAIGAPKASTEGAADAGRVEIWRDHWMCGPPGPMRCDQTCDATCDFAEIVE